MKLLWEFPQETQRVLIEARLGKYGTLIGSTSTPHSTIYTFDLGENAFPRYVVAKGVQLDARTPTSQRRKYFARALYEVNNAYAVCHHPSIQRFADIQIVHGVPLVISRKRDATLRDVIAEQPLPLHEVLSIVVQIVHALGYCAEKGIVCHQDLKPENIFVDFIPDHFAVPAEYPLRSKVHVADFELANAYLVIRHPYGSRPYMAPEQYRSLSEASLPDFSRVDVFALDVMLFELLTGGLHPVGDRTTLIWPNPQQGRSRKWLREDPWKQWLKTGATTCSEGDALDSETLAIIRHCLEVDSARRPSKRELEEQLLDRLRRAHNHAFETLAVTLRYFDGLAAEGEAGGWPYYEQRLQQLNEAFSGDEAEGAR